MINSVGLHFLWYTLHYDAMTRRTCVNTIIWLVIPRGLTEIYHDFAENTRILWKWRQYFPLKRL